MITHDIDIPSFINIVYVFENGGLTKIDRSKK
jgi:hypothetical protein